LGLLGFCHSGDVFDGGTRVHGGVRVKSHLRIHGGGSASERDECDLDLSVCVNPWGPPDGVRAAITAADITRYPDPDMTRTRSALADYAACPASCVLLGNGAAELLWSLARALISVDDVAIVGWPCFTEFEAAIWACRGRALHVCMESPSSAFDAAPLFEAVRRVRPRVVYLCAPSSPLGTHVPPEIYSALARENPATTIIVDQSYLALSRHPGDARAEQVTPPHAPPNLVLVRSLTKELGTPGVRIGYALLDPKLASRVNDERPAWGVSAAAEAAARAYVTSPEELENSRQSWLALAEALQPRLEELGCRVCSTDTIYVVAGVPERFTDAAHLRASLFASHRVLVRDCASFELPQHFRVAAHPRQALLLQAIAEAG
jgi:histidinol-phosphate aminotransferase